MQKVLKKSGVFFLTGIFVALFVGCAPKTCGSFGPVKCLSKNCCEEPKWCVKVPDSSKEVKYFCGVSEKITSERAGRTNAMEHARIQVVEYLGTFLKKEINEASSVIGLSSDILDPAHASEKEKKEYAAAMAKYVKDIEWQVNRFFNKERGLEYVRVYVLAQFPLNDETKNAGIDILQNRLEQLRRQQKIQEEELERAKKLLDRMRRR